VNRRRPMTSDRRTDCPTLEGNPTVTAFVALGFSFDDKPTINSQDELTVATSGSWYSWHGHPARAHGQDAHATVAVRRGECNHEIPGLPYPAFRTVNAERGDGKPSPYDDKEAVNSNRLSLIRSARTLARS
jgi:hypothetical protein